MTLNQCLDILEIPRDASAVTYEEAREAYRLLVQVWHPDKYCQKEKLHALATEKMKEIVAAWSQVEEHFKSGTAPEIKRVPQGDMVKSRSDVAQSIRNFYARRFGYY